MTKSRNRINGEGGAVNTGTTATTSGTSLTLSGIPAWATKITLLFNEVSFTSTDHMLVQLGTSGGIVVTGYISTSTSPGGGAATGSINKTDSMVAFIGNASRTLSGRMVLKNTTGDVWVNQHGGKLDIARTLNGGGRVDLGGTLTQLKLSGDNVSAFDAGAVTLYYE